MYEDPLQEVLGKVGSYTGTGDQYSARCPAHDDKNPSLSIGVGQDGRVLLHCHRGCTVESIVSALGLTTCALFGQWTPVCVGPAYYEYLDEAGKALFRVVRTNGGGGKTFRQETPDGAGGWASRTGVMKGVRRVLFRLPALMAAPRSETVFVVEGEKDANRLFEHGLVATTNSGGAGKWPVCERQGDGRYLKPLEGRSVVIVPDNDDVGRKHAEEVAGSVQEVAATVKIVHLPVDGQGQDVSDWLDSGGTADGLRELAKSAPLWTDEAGVEENAVEAEKTRRQSDQIVHLALDAGVVLFHDQADSPHAVFPGLGTRAIRIKRGPFEIALRRLVWESMGAVKPDALTTASLSLESMARFDGERRILDLRVSRQGDAIWVDLDGERAVRVVEGSWTVETDVPIAFRHFPHLKPLPSPARGGEIREVEQHIRIPDRDGQRLLFLCYLVAALIPGVPIPALIFHGVQGATKSTHLKLVKKLLDPSAVPVRRSVKDATEFAQAAAQNRALFFDNLSSLPDWLSDALCGLVTGDGWSKRELFSDDGTTYFEYQGLVGLGGINLIADKPDLLDRSLIFELEPVPQEERLPEDEFWEAFEEARPRILGGMFDLLGKALELRPNVRIESLPRMADFARCGAAIAQAMGHPAEEFLAAYERNIGLQHRAAIEASPTAQVVEELMRDRDTWSGSPSDLLEALQERALAVGVSTKATGWPSTASWLIRRLKQSQTNLKAIGITWVEKRSRKTRRIELSRSIPEERDGIVTGGDTKDTNGVTRNALESKGRDGNDTSDTISGNSQGYTPFEERAAIAEFDGCTSREGAEELARKQAASLEVEL